MSNNNFRYTFTADGNIVSVIEDIRDKVDTLNNKITDTTATWEVFQAKIFKINQMTQYVTGLANSLQELNAPGAALNASMASIMQETTTASTMTM